MNPCQIVYPCFKSCAARAHARGQEEGWTYGEVVAGHQLNFDIGPAVGRVGSPESFDSVSDLDGGGSVGRGGGDGGLCEGKGEEGCEGPGGELHGCDFSLLR